jgi:integrase
MKPAKPRDDFPLFAHNNGYWAKKIRGKLHYFGKWATDRKGQRALEQWAEQKDALLAGRTPRTTGDGLTVRDLVNRFLSFKLAMVKSNELRQATWDEYNGVCGTVVKQFGRNRLVSDLDSADFETLRAAFAETAGPVRLGKLVQVTRCLFKYGYDAGLISEPVRYGPAFKRPSKAVLRRHRAEQGPKLFSPSEIRELLEAANPVMRAFVLLGLNAALGNSDVARLEFPHLDLTAGDGWGMLDYARGKTGIARRAALWPETRQAIEAAIATRKQPANKEDSERVFITKRGASWEKGTTDKPVSKEFAKLCKAVGIVRKGATFYALRHTARTVMDETRDFPAIDLVMGHARDDMASIYRERIDDSRLRALAEYLRSWLWPEAASDGQGGDPHKLKVVG